MKTLKTLLIVALLGATGITADAPPGSEPSAPPGGTQKAGAPPSRWDANRDGRLDATERKAMLEGLRRPALTGPTNGIAKAQARQRKVGPEADRRAERIQRALGGSKMR